VATTSVPGALEANMLDTLETVEMGFEIDELSPEGNSLHESGNVFATSCGLERVE
jgi:hypothetical protein